MDNDFVVIDGARVARACVLPVPAMFPMADVCAWCGDSVRPGWCWRYYGEDICGPCYEARRKLVETAMATLALAKYT
jgi:hypothetical protein